MNKMIFVLILSFGSVISGYLVQRLVLRSAVRRNTGSGTPEKAPAPERLDLLSNLAKWIKVITLAGLLPWPILFTFWRIQGISPHFLVIPILGLASLIIGGIAALVIIKITRLPPDKAGSLYACGMMTNLGIIGGLIGLLFFGNEGFMVVQLFTMFEVFTYYLVVFPLSQQIGRGVLGAYRFDFRLLLSKPMSLIPIGAILLGLLLRGLKVPAPEFLDVVSAYLVPAVTGLIGFSIGLTLKVSKLKDYRRESALIALIKFVIIPSIIIPAAVLLGLPSLLGGVAFKMVIFLSFSPVALIALVPPQLYGLDLDLSNSGWLVTTVIHLIIVPLLIILLV